jgi:hypothetical protein
VTSRPFTAQYRGRCYECPDPIEIGDEVVWAGDDTRMVAHVQCIRPREIGTVRPPCPACNLVHAGECF